MIEYDIKKTLASIDQFELKMAFLQRLGEFINRESQLIAAKQGEWVEVLPEDEEENVSETASEN